MTTATRPADAAPAVAASTPASTPASTHLTDPSIVRPDVTLEDKYTAVHGRIYLSGIQALVRLPMMQRLRDEAAGLNTAGFISGYRGSPLACSMRPCGKPSHIWTSTM